MNDKIIADLDQLFDAASPATLRRSINHVFYQYLINADTLPVKLDTIAEDFYFLLDFLEKADTHYEG